MKKYVKYFLFALFEMLMITVIVVLILKLRDLYNGKVKGAQHVAVIKKEDVVLGDGEKLKYFYEPKPNHKQVDDPDWLNYEVINTINSDGLNEKKEYALEKPPLTYRIVTLGDSFTFGMYVPTEENYTEVLEDMLNDKIVCKDIKQFEIINLGVPGYDIEYSVERFIKRGLKYKPDLVIFLLNNWSFRGNNELTLPVKEKLIRQGVKDLNQETGIYEAANAAISVVNKKYGEKFILEYQKRSLFRLKNYYKGRLIIISFPSLEEKYKQIIEEFIPGSPFDYFDNIFDIFSSEDYQLLDHHPNKRGHTKIAESILSIIYRKFLITTGGTLQCLGSESIPTQVDKK